jgi:hypothetical protein
VVKNVVEEKKEKCDGKWKTVEFPFEEVANLEKVLKNMEAKMSYVIENLTVRITPAVLGLLALIRLSGVHLGSDEQSRKGEAPAVWCSPLKQGRRRDTHTHTHTRTVAGRWHHAARGERASGYWRRAEGGGRQGTGGAAGYVGGLSTSGR